MHYAVFPWPALPLIGDPGVGIGETALKTGSACFGEVKVTQEGERAQLSRSRA